MLSLDEGASSLDQGKDEGGYVTRRDRPQTEERRSETTRADNARRRREQRGSRSIPVTQYRAYRSTLGNGRQKRSRGIRRRARRRAPRIPAPHIAA